MNEPLTPVILRGPLAAKFGARRMLAVRRPSEAIRALIATVPGFEDYLRTSGLEYAILVRQQPIDPETEMGLPTGTGEIRIVPRVKGSKNGFWKFVSGVAMIVLAAYGYGGQLASSFGASASGAAAFNSFVGAMGLSMAIGGIAQMLTGSPNKTYGSEGSNSSLFSSGQNTVAQGVSLPVLCGEFYCTPPLVSEAIDTEAYSATVFNGSYDGNGTWLGDGDTTPWGASLTAK
ncbi:tail assembly protein [Mesoterricola sediminis]|uniref:Tail assembly protein n=1 Tax=Mesoterricola sediminis TaxID=2927980 RepID=A0AA48KBN6_9BACT|nr:hypothetical protein [Mesoterricola sediminis]BDU76309.1 tail assembly protein [Mesoterricola sediminis]